MGEYSELQNPIDSALSGPESESCSVVSHSVQEPMDGSQPGYSVHGILQARVLEWLAIPFSRGSSQLRDPIWISHIADRVFSLLSDQPGKPRFDSRSYLCVPMSVLAMLTHLLDKEQLKSSSVFSFLINYLFMLCFGWGGSLQLYVSVL